MGSFCQSGTTVNQSQTYNPNPYATGAITGALNQAGQVSQTPFQTPVAPVAPFSNQQRQAFNIVGQTQGMAQPYLDQAQDYFSGNRVGQFFNPFASNVLAGLKDVFGEQQQQATGNLQQQAGGVGADRVAVGQADLAKQQGLAAGQTLAGLYQPALAASQNAGFGIGALGPVAQNAALQGATALLGTGGLQQQQQQAELNAPYQNRLAQIQWPYQNAQFNAGIVGALAPGLGGTTNGQTTYPQQSPWGTIAGLGLAGAGLAGQSGLFGGLQNMWNGYNYDGSMSGNQWAALGQQGGGTNFVSPAYNAQTGVYNPNWQGAATGGRINPYAEGGAVDLPRQEDGSYGDDLSDKIHSAEINELMREAHAPPSFNAGAPGGVRPINVASQSLVPSGRIPAIQAHIPQLPSPSQQQQGGGGGFLGTLGSAIGTAAKILPMFAASGGRVNPYAEGGEVEAEIPDEPPSFMTHRQRALDAADPFERAALRTRQSVRPTAGRAEGPMMGAAGTALAAFGGPEALMARYAPRVLGGIYGTMAGGAPTEAGENEFKWSDPNQDRARRLEKIEQEMALEATRKTPSAPGTQKARLDSLAREKEDLLKARGEDYNLARTSWEKQQEQLRQEALERKAAETSLFDKIPGTRAAITAASPAVSYLGGKFLGKRLSPWASIPVGATAGAIEGAASIAGPTEMDINSLPRSSPTRQEAEADLDRKTYWQRVGLAAGVSGAAGALGSLKGYAGTRGILPPRAVAPPPTAALPEAAEKAVRAVSKPKAKVTEIALPDGSIAKRYDYGTHSRWMQNGKFIKAPTQNAPSTPRTQASGGAVHPYASGGEVPYLSEQPKPAWSELLQSANDSGDPTERLSRWGVPAAEGDKFVVPPNRFDTVFGGVEGRNDGFVLNPDKYDSLPNEGNFGLIDDSNQPDEPDDLPEPVNPYAPAEPAEKPGEKDFASVEPEAAPSAKQHLADSPWMALLHAGLGTLAASGQRDGHGLPLSPAAAIGQGGMKGMEALRQQRESAMKQQTIEQGARRLDQQAAFQMAQMKQREDALKESQRQHDFQQSRPFTGPMDERGMQKMYRYDKKTGQYVEWSPEGGEAAQRPAFQQGDPGVPQPGEGLIPANARLTQGGAYDYSQGEPFIEKGLDIPEPRPIAGRSANAIKTQAEYYAQTGKLPSVRGTRGPVAMADQNFRNSVQNYGNALLASRGLTPTQVADTWRAAPGMLRFIMGPDGRSTVALGTAVRHLDTLRELSNAYRTKDSQTINRLNGFLSREFGNAAVTNLEAAGRIVGPEIIKALGVAGAGTTEERTNASKQFGVAASPEQVMGAIETTQKLLGGQLTGRKQQAELSGVDETHFKRLIGERPYQILTDLESKKEAPANDSLAAAQAAIKAGKSRDAVIQRLKEHGIDPTGL